MAFQTAYLKAVPESDDFLNAGDLIINTFYNEQEPDLFLNKFLITCLKNKLQGNAKLMIGAHEVTNWNEIKTSLQQNFANKLDENSLLRDLTLLKQSSNETPAQFCLQCQDLQKIVQVPVNNNASEAILNYSKFQNIKMPSAVVKINNNLTTTTMFNPTEKITFTKPLIAEPINQTN
ncbi:hypothetical protein BDFB_010674 [Asbolus verrucosus]|uniref:Uncharacterized protein n=1 Tax=Asbolus verrucosus TaxID=1661398 RepID=A0A482VHV0_ASBVE|nr:hypothetical protein BDFB_010674 [Asbolus verrucosus]